MSDVSKGDGRTILFVSHNMEAVRVLCNKGIILNNGEISYNGNTDDAIRVYSSNNKKAANTRIENVEMNSGH